MAVKLYREYRIKFYLNMRHYIIIDGKKGEIHPHTWEFALDIKFGIRCLMMKSLLTA